jgi:uncharacterized repeat protein (TIGR03803 family)
MTPSAWAQRYKTLHKFTGGKDGSASLGGLIFDAAGNLYGTTYEGGRYGWGSVFELRRGATGEWTETVLHNFGKVNDGALPDASLTFDSAGNLYGTTPQGGVYGGGTAFELTPGANGKWIENVLYSFCSLSNCEDGAIPTGALVRDPTGNLYGTTAQGFGECGGSPCGVVFELTSDAKGKWREKVLHRFRGNDGSTPYGSLIFDMSGILYGITFSGGSYGQGTAYQLAPKANGRWTETVLHNFGSSGDGSGPFAGLILDAVGKLYGTTYSGGAHLGGSVFYLTRGAKGKWTETVLHSFSSGTDGFAPYTSLVFDGAGNLYGTTAEGGNFSQCTGTGCGVVFELTPGTGGAWKEKVLHRFGDGKDGAYPFADLILDATGNLYGTASQGGGSGCSGSGCGMVFEITP